MLSSGAAEEGGGAIPCWHPRGTRLCSPACIPHSALFFSNANASRRARLEVISLFSAREFREWCFQGLPSEVRVRDICSFLLLLLGGCIIFWPLARVVSKAFWLLLQQTKRDGLFFGFFLFLLHCNVHSEDLLVL